MPIAASGRSGLVIAAAGCRPGAQLVLRAYTSPHSTEWCGRNEGWKLHLLRSGYDSIYAHYHGRYECMMVTGGYERDARLKARPCHPRHPSANQRFHLTEPASDGLSSDSYHIVPASGKQVCLAPAGSSDTPGGRAAGDIALRSCGGSHISAWTIPAAPTHTETWAMDDSASAGWCNGGYGASPSLVRQWLTYAETNCGPADTKGLDDCHADGITYCTVIQYFNTSKIWSGNPIASAPAQEDWWLHERGYTDAAHRLTDSSPGWGRANWLNQTNPAARRWIADYISTHYNVWDALFLDDTAASLKAQFYRSDVPPDKQYTSSQELRTNQAVVEEHEALARVLDHADGTPFAQVNNGISPNPWIPNTLKLLDHPGGVVGLMSEGHPWEDGFSPFYSNLLDVIAAVDARPNVFIVLLSYDPNGSLQARRVQEATVLLGYEPGHVVSAADLEQRNLDLSVWPEEGIYPTVALESMNRPRGEGCLKGGGTACRRGGHNDLRVAGGYSPIDRGAGVYRREFEDCYDRGVWFGRCAAIVNDTSSPVTVRGSWLRQSYVHVITMRGGDVQSGGTIDLTGATFRPGVTRIPADDAILLAQ